MKRTVGIIGCGNMGEAILAQGLKCKTNSYIICEKDKLKKAFVSRRYRVKVARNIFDLAGRSDVIIIAVKPQDIDIVLDELHEAIQLWKKTRILIISVVAGVKTGYIEKKISIKPKVVLAMPNMPAKIGEGVTALVRGRFATDKDLKLASDIFKALGEVVTISKEGLINAVTALSGSGPAYVSFIFLAMLIVAEELGLNRKDANKLIYQTIVGSMDLLKKDKFDAETLISKVASKGGTTEAALKVFRDKKLTGIILDALKAAYKRAGELSR